MIVSLLVLVFIHQSSVEALSCYSCNGANCPEAAGRCTLSELDAKCFIRVDPNNLTYWGCVSSSKWKSRVNLRQDGCREDPDMGWQGRPSVWCLCSAGDYCNTDPLNIAIRYSRSLPEAVLRRIDTSKRLRKNGAKKFTNGDDVIRKIHFHEKQARNNIRDLIAGGAPSNARPTRGTAPAAAAAAGAAGWATRDNGFIRRTGAARQGPAYDYPVNEPIPPVPAAAAAASAGFSYPNAQNSVDSFVHGLYEDYLDTRPFIPRIRDCRVHNGYCEQYCVRGWNGMGYCACEDGYTVAEDLMTCEDQDECEQENGGCLHHCVNLAGSYHCQCLDGYYMMPDNKTCYEIDECRQNNGGCAYGCHNLPGSFVCTCPTGYELSWDQRNCTDSDECRFEARCEQGCTNTIGSYECNCTEGYRLNDDGYTCVDVDECADDQTVCDQKCVNIAGSYICGCGSGYDIDKDNRTCSDIDECAEANGGCHHTCENSAGSFRCSCAAGFLLLEDGLSCLELLPGEKCVKGNGGCGHNCSDVIHPNYTAVDCSCLEGFSLNTDNKTCSDVDECNPAGLAPKACDHGCTNSLGSYVCDCNAGYELVDGRHCVDLNECERGNGGCDDICVNTDSSYFCACSNGFWLHADKHQCVGV